ncbi:MAG: FG-GAP-like repeat-containing protein [Gemmatimonadales bacterium]
MITTRASVSFEVRPSRRGAFRAIGCLALVWILAIAGCRRPASQDVGALVTARTLGLIHLQENRLVEAETELRKVEALAPNQTVGPANLALVYLRMGRYPDAESAVGRALAIDSSDVNLRLLRAKVLELTGRRDLAREELERLTERAGSEPRVFYALAELWQGVADTAAAAARLANLVRVAELAPANLAARVDLAAALVGAGEADRALAELETVRQMPPAPPAEAAPFLAEAIRALREGRDAQAAEPLARFRRFLDGTVAFQVALAALRTPQGEVSGIPVLTFTPDFMVRAGLGEDSLAPVAFVDATTASGLPSEPRGALAPALAAGDLDGDGWDELLVGRSDGPTELWRWDSTAWRDVGRTVGLGAEVALAAAFGDYDNDGHLDLVVSDTLGYAHLYRNDGRGALLDRTAGAVPGPVGRASRALFVDLDQDGDLDLFFSTSEGNRFLRNDADGSFTELTEASGLGGATGGRDVAFGDLDADGLVDLAVASEQGGIEVFSSRDAGRFERGSKPGGLPAAAGRAVAIGDLDNDGFLDLVTVAGPDGRAALHRGDREGGFRLATGALPPSAPRARAVALLDYDNDGRLDVALAAEAGGVALLHNEGGRFVDRSAAVSPGLPAATAIVPFDFGRDLDLDLLVAGPDGMRVLRNDGGNLNHVAQVRLTGLGAGSGKNNAMGIGAVLEVRAGDLYQMRVVTQPVTTIGLGRRLKADVLRVVWPNGVPQTLYYPGGDQDVLEQQVLNSSCAFLYAWNGERYEFVTDLMWKSALGMPVGIGGAGGQAYAPAAASREYLAIPEGALVPDGGRYRIQLTEELWETAYADQLELIVVDRPDSVDALVDERFVPPDQDSTLRLILASGARPPVSAVDERGREVLPLLAERDFRFVSDFTPTRYQGVVEPHELTLDLGPIEGGGALLFLSGWIFPTDANLNVAIAQASDLAVAPPELQVKDRQGRWVTAIPDIGFPSGKNKTVVVDLAGVLPPGSHEVRLRTNMEIYWDQVLVARRVEGPAPRVTRLRPVEADLHYRGFSRSYRRGGRYGPHWFDYDRAELLSPWQPIPGSLTRFGDVLELFLASDDRYAVMGPGDEVTLGFDTSELPSLEPGWRRGLFVYSVGWIKDANRNTGRGGTVGPLPFHAMSRYPYSAPEAFVADPARRAFAERYLTRPGPTGGLLRPEPGRPSTEARP